MSLTSILPRRRPAATAAVGGPVVPGAALPSRRTVWRDWVGRVPTFLVVGLLSTILYGLLYLALQAALGNQAANAVALVLSTIAGTIGHRALTFDVHGSASVVPHQALGLGVLGAGLAITSGSLWLLDALAPEATLAVELVVLGVANGLAGLVRFVSFAVVMRGRRAVAEDLSAT